MLKKVYFDEFLRLIKNEKNSIISSICNENLYALYNYLNEDENYVFDIEELKGNICVINGKVDEETSCRFHYWSLCVNENTKLVEVQTISLY